LISPNQILEKEVHAMMVRPLATFGHTGFTGTAVWSDPENELTVVFLSNRVYPVADNPKLVKMGIRTDIQKIIYKALEKGEKQITRLLLCVYSLFFRLISYFGNELKAKHANAHHRHSRRALAQAKLL
jgi:CubicO group peptidase (beta-lactamase class C family)